MRRSTVATLWILGLHVMKSENGLKIMNVEELSSDPGSRSVARTERLLLLCVSYRLDCSANDDEMQMSSSRHEILDDYPLSWWSPVNNRAELPCVVGYCSVILESYNFKSIAERLRILKVPHQQSTNFKFIKANESRTQLWNVLSQWQAYARWSYSQPRF